MGFNSGFKGLNQIGGHMYHSLPTQFIYIILRHCLDEIIYENDQQDATVYDKLLFLVCSTCFKRYFLSSSGASKLHYRFWYYTRMSLPAGIVGVLELSR